ncbi:M16 family metallopeptidase [Adhaeribacter aquaticus]|uniref:M16 family metallopeptidase n=1 Tax=Adhaeribacter aquaticus TaxID=299567 RepID=UPI00040DF981|nr:pitrilysin family protein [Adhaeribacter aquaticus]
MVNRSIAPPVEDLNVFDLPTPEVILLQNGARIHCFRNFQQPIIKLEIVFKAGKWFEPKKGLSYLTAKLLLEGTKDKTSKQIADYIAFYGASLECNQGYDRSALTLYCLSKHFLKLLALIHEILAEVSFPEEDYKQLQKRLAQNIQVEKQKTGYLATALFTQNIYGNNHPYSTSLEEEEIAAVTRNEIQNFYSTFYNIQTAEIFVSGNITEDTLNTLTKTLGTLPTGPTYNTKEIISPNFSIEKESYINLPEKLQSSIRIGGSFPLISNPDYPKLNLLNKILGGYFGSRLMKNIREDKGFTYGIHSALSTKEKDTLFYIATDVNYLNSKETIKEVFKEIEILKNEKLEEEELNQVKNFIVGKFLNETTNIFDQVDKYKSIVYHNLPQNFYPLLLSEVSQTKPEDLLIIANKYLSNNSLFITSVGKQVVA